MQHECRSSIVFCTPDVAPLDASDVLCVATQKTRKQWQFTEIQAHLIKPPSPQNVNWTSEISWACILFRGDVFWPPSRQASCSNRVTDNSIGHHRATHHAEIESQTTQCRKTTNSTIGRWNFRQLALNLHVKIEQLQFHCCLGHCRRDSLARFFRSKNHAAPDFAILWMPRSGVLWICYPCKPACHNIQQSIHVLHVHTQGREKYITLIRSSGVPLRYRSQEMLRVR